MLRKSVTLSLQEKISFINKSGKQAFSLSNPSFNPKNLKNINLKYFNLQGNLSGDQRLKDLTVGLKIRIAPDS